MRFAACLGAGTIAGAAAAGTCAFVLEALVSGAFWGQILKGAVWLILDHQAERHGRPFHPLVGAAWAAGQSLPPAQALAPRELSPDQRFVLRS